MKLYACLVGVFLACTIGAGAASAQAARTCTEQTQRCVAMCNGMQGSDPANCRAICQAGHATCMRTGSFAAQGYRPVTGLEKR